MKRRMKMEKRNNNDTLTVEVVLSLYELGIIFEINDGHVTFLSIEMEEI